MILFDGEVGQSMISITVQFGVRQFLGGFMGGIFGEAYEAAGELANRLDITETLYSVTVGKVNRILDSGATTNLLSGLNHGEWVTGTRQVSGALGSGSTEQLTNFGNILNTTVHDELFSMGKFVAGGA